ncbi:hypothetical protein HAX54_051371, partial [Datura stramonium]|nr:hypothetical protein [Datura stramonium]
LQKGHLSTISTLVSTMMEDNRSSVPMVARLNVETLAEILMNYEGNDLQGYIEMVNALQGMGSYNFRPKKLDWT